MLVAVYSTHKFEREYIKGFISKHTLCLLETRLTLETASLAQGSLAVSIFVNDDASAPVLARLNGVGVK
jgi:D-lactate dehydrogenase